MTFERIDLLAMEKKVSQTINFCPRQKIFVQADGRDNAKVALFQRFLPFV